MPASKGGLLRTGVSDLPLGRSTRPFDIGGIGVLTSTRPFDIEQPPILVKNTRPFDISGITAAYSTRPFDILGDLLLLSIRPFDIIETVQDPLPGTIIPGPEETATTTLTATANAGDITITVSSGAGFRVGQVISVGGEYRRIVNIT